MPNAQYTMYYGTNIIDISDISNMICLITLILLLNIDFHILNLGIYPINIDIADIVDILDIFDIADTLIQLILLVPALIPS